MDGFGDGGNGGLSPLMIMQGENPFLFPPANPSHGRIFKSNGDDAEAEKNRSDIKAKIMRHPLYPRLLSGFISCHKLGAPPEVVERMEEICRSGGGNSRIGEDPALDQFMEAYCEMLTKYEEELSKPFREAMIFLSRVETQFQSLSMSSSSGKGAVHGRGGSPEDGGDAANEGYLDPHAEDKELKGQLLRKYSGYLGSLKQEFLKRKKKGKLPKEARLKLLDWWNCHYKWPYPSESQKVALADSTGLDPKQINNWFINQRKRHWKPAEDMPFAAIAAAQAGPIPPPEFARSHYYIDNAFPVGYGLPFDVTRQF